MEISTVDQMTLQFVLTVQGLLDRFRTKRFHLERRLSLHGGRKASPRNNFMPAVAYSWGNSNDHYGTSQEQNEACNTAHNYFTFPLVVFFLLF